MEQSSGNGNKMITPIVYSIHKKEAHPLFGEDTLHITARDEAGGLFVTIEQVCPSFTSEEYFGKGKMTLELEELEDINKVVELLKKDWKE